MREFPTAVRVLRDADVLAARSWLRYRYTDDAAATLRDAKTALALDRTNVLAHIVATTLTHAISPKADQVVARICTMAGGAAPSAPPAVATPRQPRPVPAGSVERS